MLAVSSPVSIFVAPVNPTDGKTNLLKSLVEAVESWTAELLYFNSSIFIFEQ